jgi:hypothetical protein
VRRNWLLELSTTELGQRTKEHDDRKSLLPWTLGAGRRRLKKLAASELREKSTVVGGAWVEEQDGQRSSLPARS